MAAERDQPLWQWLSRGGDALRRDPPESLVFGRGGLGARGWERLRTSTSFLSKNPAGRYYRGMDTKNILLAGAVAAMVPVIQNVAIKEPIPACGIEAERSTTLACLPEQPAQHHIERDADAPTYQATVGITVTPTFDLPGGATMSRL
jgi:hypothetical protein